MPGVRIYPYKEVESGAQVAREPDLGVARARRDSSARTASSGLVNVDLTPGGGRAARGRARHGAASAARASSRAARRPPACRMIKRAMIAGLTSTGVDVADLRVLPARGQPPPAEDARATRPASTSASSAADPEVVQIHFFERPGIQLTPALAEGDREALHARQELRRVGRRRGRRRSATRRACARATRTDLLATLDVDAIRARGFRIVVDYGYSAASFVLPLVLGPLGVEAVVRARVRDRRAPTPARRRSRESIGQAKQLVAAVGADLGVVFDRAGERLYLVDEPAREIPVEQALLLFLRLIGANGRHGKLAFPITVTSQVDQLVEGSGLEVVRTPASLADLTKAAAEDGVDLRRRVGGGYVFPEFLPAYDAIASLCKLLELLAPVDAAALRARRRAARVDARPPRRCRARGR